MGPDGLGLLGSGWGQPRAPGDAFSLVARTVRLAGTDSTHLFAAERIDTPGETNAVAYRVTRPGCSRTESFLIENRQQIKWDSLLPGSGLLVWHVDDSRPNNTDEARPILALVQADGFF